MTSPAHSPCRPRLTLLTASLVLCLSLIAACGGSSAPSGSGSAEPGSTLAASSAAQQKPAVSTPAPPTPMPTPSPTPIPLDPIRLVAPPVAFGSWAVDVAERKGFFRQERIAVQRAEDDPQKAVESVNLRERDIALVPATTVVGAVRGGQELVMVAGALNRAPYSLIGARDVEDVGGLAGKAVGIRDPRDVPGAILRRLLRGAGLGDSAYRLLGFAGPGVPMAAVTNGTVAGSLLEAAQAARLQGAGFKTLANAWDVVPSFQAEAFATRVDWARAVDERLVRFLRAILAADRWIYAPENRAEATEILSGTLKLTADEAGRVYEQYVEKLPAIPRQGELEEAGIRAVLDLLAEVEALPPPLPDPSTLTDTSYLQRAR